MTPTSNPDSELETVVSEIQRMDPTGSRIARVLRESFDQIYDGQRSGHYRWDQLHKTEKTHFGTLVEINLNHEFRFGEGHTMDYSIAGVEVDCKYSQTIGGWMIPREAIDHLCLLVWADDEQGVWSLGIIRITANILNSGKNLDSKRTISAANRVGIRWIFDKSALPPNVLLQLNRATVDRIMALPSGQQRVNEIFRVAQGRRIGGAVIATLAQQKDYMKRVRGNGGARSTLKAEGFIILGHYQKHRRIARELEVEVPKKGEFVAVRVVRASAGEPGAAKINDSYWRLAKNGDNVTTAPDVPHS